MNNARVLLKACLLYTSDAADEEDSVDLGGSRIIQKKKNKKKKKAVKKKKKQNNSNFCTIQKTEISSEERLGTDDSTHSS